MSISKLFQEFLIGQEDKIEKEVNVAGAVILKMNDEGTKSILLIRRSPSDHYPNHWEFPRGKCDKGDKNKLDECLKREVKEESGLDVDILEYINKYEYIADHGTRRSTQYNYLCKLKNPKQEVKLSKEHSEFKWVTNFGEVELLVSNNEIKRTIAKVLNLDSSIINYPTSKEVIGETQKRWNKK